MGSVRIKSKGSYYVGGRKVTVTGGEPYYATLVEGWAEPQKFSPDGDYQAGQMYVQYTRLEDPVVPYPVCMIHGGGLCGAMWEQTLDGRPGWEFRFLQRGYNVNVSDGVERGRASWARYPEINPGPPVFRNYEEGWTTFRLGEKYPDLYEGARFDPSKYDYLAKQFIPRWVTSTAWAEEAYDLYVEQMTEGCILMAHSQGGLFAIRAALKHPENVRAIILVESSSTIDVDTEDVSSLKGIPFLHVWGDFLGGEYANERFTWVGDYAYEGTMRKLHSKILELGGDSTWIHLPEIGIRGNSHAMMNEDNSNEIADLILDWLDRHFQK